MSAFIKLLDTDIERDAESLSSSDRERARKANTHRARFASAPNGIRCGFCKTVSIDTVMKDADYGYLCHSCFVSQRKCAICGVMFPSRVNNKKTCKPECGRAFYLNKQKEKAAAARKALKEQTTFDFSME